VKCARHPRYRGGTKPSGMCRICWFNYTFLWERKHKETSNGVEWKAGRK